MAQRARKVCSERAAAGKWEPLQVVHLRSPELRTRGTLAICLTPCLRRLAPPCHVSYNPFDTVPSIGVSIAAHRETCLWAASRYVVACSRQCSTGNMKMLRTCTLGYTRRK